MGYLVLMAQYHCDWPIDAIRAYILSLLIELAQYLMYMGLLVLLIIGLSN